MHRKSRVHAVIVQARPSLAGIGADCCFSEGAKAIRRSLLPAPRITLSPSSRYALRILVEEDRISSGSLWRFDSPQSGWPLVAPPLLSDAARCLSRIAHTQPPARCVDGLDSKRGSSKQDPPMQPMGLTQTAAMAPERSPLSRLSRFGRALARCAHSFALASACCVNCSGTRASYKAALGCV